LLAKQRNYGDYQKWHPFGRFAKRHKAKRGLIDSKVNVEQEEFSVNEENFDLIS